MPVIVTGMERDWNPSLEVTPSLCGRCVQKFKTNHQGETWLTDKAVWIEKRGVRIPLKIVLLLLM